METALQIQRFAHECVLMHALLRDGRPLTGFEYDLLETHLEKLALEIAEKKFHQNYEHEQNLRKASAR